MTNMSSLYLIAMPRTFASSTSWLNKGFVVRQGIARLEQHLFSSWVGIGAQWPQKHHSGIPSGGGSRSSGSSSCSCEGN